MGINEAIELFEISDVNQETEETLKKKYRKLMLKYHPDVCGDDTKAKDITIAYDVLKEALVKLQQFKLMYKETERITVLIPLSKLIDIYSGGSIKVGQGDDEKTITNKTIRKYNVLVISDVVLTHNGITESFSNVEPWNISDTYEINTEIFVNELDNREDITLKIAELSKNISITSQSVKFRVTLPYNICINIIITKKIRIEKEEEHT